MHVAMLCNLILTTCVMAGAKLGLFCQLMEFRFHRRNTIIVASAFVGLLAGVRILLSIWFDWHGIGAIWSLLIMTIPSMIFLFIVSKYRGVRFFATFGIADISISLIDMLLYLLVLQLFGWNFTLGTIVRCSAMIAWCVAIHFIMGNRYRRSLYLLDSGWELILISLLGQYVMVCALMSFIDWYPNVMAEHPADLIASIIVALNMELMVLIIIRLIRAIVGGRAQKVREKALQDQVMMAKEQHQVMEETIDQIRRLRHDMKYHMDVIYGLLQNEEYDRLRDYLAEYQKELMPLNAKLPIYTKHQTINILIMHYARWAEAENIGSEFLIEVPKTLSIDDTHLTVLLGNLLQNAMEACLRLPPDEERILKMHLLVHQKKLLVKCENSAAVVKKESDGSYSSKEKQNSYGIGLSNIALIIAQYHGFCEYGYCASGFYFEGVLSLD